MMERVMAIYERIKRVIHNPDAEAATLSILDAQRKHDEALLRSIRGNARFRRISETADEAMQQRTRGRERLL